MGSGVSIQVLRDRDPNLDPNRPDSVSVATSMRCKIPDSNEDCRLNIDRSISTSAVTLSRVSTAGAFSDDTKIKITPSLPFRMYCNGAEVRVTQMMLYHPCPLRIENVQYDAVLSLNDPSDGDTQSILLIPIVGASASTPSAKMLDRIGPRLASLLSKNESGGYDPVEVPTGADWSLSTLIPTVGTRVQSGFYQWISGRGYESYSTQEGLNIHVRYRPRNPRQNYILMDTPIQASQSTLAMILALPRTDPLKALPAVSPAVTYTPCAKTVVEQSPPVREGFEGQCDPFQYKDTTGNRKQTVLWIVGSLATVAMVMVGLYVGLLAAGGQLSIQTKELGDTAGEFLYKQIAAVKSAKSALSGSVTDMIAKKAGLPTGMLPASLPSGLVR
jgi:hypothetical protein